MGSWELRRKQIVRASSTCREELDHRRVSRLDPQGSWREQGSRSWTQENGCWKCLQSRMGVRAYRQATAGEGDVISLQCESDLVVMAADGKNP